ncbi:MAG: sigma-54 dependent transcriptional regulator [Sphingomonadales bacterium]
MALDILIVDDEDDIRNLIAGILSDEGYETRTAHDSDSAFREIEARRPSLLVLDIWLQGSKWDGLEILKIVKSRHKDLPVVMISGHGNVETAVAAIKLGAYDFIEKPFQTDKLLHLVERATEAERLRRENAELKQKAGLVTDLVGRSSSMNQLRVMLEKVAPTGSRVLISGPAGVGKEVVARIIHARSPREGGNFVVVNSANIAPERMEQELFGVEQNGTVVKTGLFEQAHGGTLFLDEVADMPGPTQAKILRVLTEQTFNRVGGAKMVQVDVRVISATARNLQKAIRNGEFREDLYHRLNVVPVRVPPMTERREDIPGLVEHFMIQLSAATGRPPRLISEDAIAAMQAYDWPGNVRQIKNLVEQLIILADDDCDEISASNLPKEISSQSAEMLGSDGHASIMAIPLRQAREAFEREYLKVQITRFSGNISRTAVFVGMERSALHRKLKTLGLSSQRRTRSRENS